MQYLKSGHGRAQSLEEDPNNDSASSNLSLLRVGSKFRLEEEGRGYTFMTELAMKK